MTLLKTLQLEKNLKPLQLQRLLDENWCMCITSTAYYTILKKFNTTYYYYSQTGECEVWE